MDIGVIVPIVAVVFIFSIPLSAIWTEYFRDKALIEKGLYQPKQPAPSTAPDWRFLLAGSILTGIGVASLIATFVFAIGKFIGAAGFLLLFVGIALMVVYLIAREKKIPT